MPKACPILDQGIPREGGKTNFRCILSFDFLLENVVDCFAFRFNFNLIFI
jgi:hypothetical protein